MIGHPREDALLAFQDHRLDDRRRRRLAGHLSGCQRCRNVVQAHRTVRGVFALEAPFAPDGVLERALASRAAGMIVMLPVAEPGARRRMELPSRGFLIAAGLVLTIGVGLQAFPADRLQQVWGAMSAVIAVWEPGNGPYKIDLAYPNAPIARPAEFDPSRLRPMTVTYVYTIRNLNPDAENRTSQEFTLTASLARDVRGWVVSESYNGMGPSLRSRFDSLTLGAFEWEHFERFERVESAPAFVTRVTPRVHDSKITKFWLGTPKPHLLQQNPPATEYAPLELKFRHPRWVGNAHLHLQLMAIHLDRGWAGSLARFWPRAAPWGGGPRPVTYLVTGDETVTTPLGSFDTWVVSELGLPTTGESGFNVRKSDGLVLRSFDRNRYQVSEYLLESVTYP